MTHISRTPRSPTINIPKNPKWTAGTPPIIKSGARQCPVRNPKITVKSAAPAKDNREIAKDPHWTPATPVVFKHQKSKA